MCDFIKTDVLIVGAGPVGLLTATGLHQQGVETLVIEKRELDVQTAFGRATTLYPRSLELLEPLGVTKNLTQEGFVARSAVNFKDGKRVNGRGWDLMFNHLKPSYLDFALNIRQRYSESIFRERYESYGKSVWFGWQLTHFAIDTSLNDGYNVSATIKHPSKGSKQVRSKYILGSDGGSSFVRRTANIELDSDPTTYQWIRIDGKFSIDMPSADMGFASVETERHGNILWVRLDRDAYRIGFALTPELLKKYPNGVTEEEALYEAKEGMKPFNLEIERLDWWTNYKIKQSVAQSLQKDQFILLGGDAAHVHSSGFAQGMNTGIHDATNLAWKLGGTIKGWYKPSVLETYESERRAAAQKLIQIDTTASAVISGDIPETYKGLISSADELLWKLWVDNIGFNTGLGITYAKSVLNRDTLDTTLQCGIRAPDALICALGPRVPLRLYEALLEDGVVGRWSVVVFAGNPALTSAGYEIVRKELPQVASSHEGMVRFLTVIAGSAGSTWLALDGPSMGKAYFDGDGSAHSEYGVDQSSGAIAVLRPDNIVAFAAGLNQVHTIAEYFKDISV